MTLGFFRAKMFSLLFRVVSTAGGWNGLELPLWLLISTCFFLMGDSMLASGSPFLTFETSLSANLDRLSDATPSTAWWACALTFLR